MTLFNSGDIVLIGFPFTDLSGTKQRPAIVISSDWYNEKRIEETLSNIKNILLKIHI